MSASTIAAVSSTDSVVWVRKARFAAVGTSIDCASSTVSTRVIEPSRNLAEGADHLRMAGMADEQDVPAFLDQPLRLAMDLRDQRAGRVDIGQAAVLRGGGHRLGHAVRGKDDRAVVGDLVEFVDEYRAQLAQPVDDEAVMDDFVADIDRRAEPLERELDDLDRAVDAGAKAARRGDQDAKGGSEVGFRHGAGHVRHRLQP